MQQQLSLKLLPSEAADESVIRSYIAQAAGKKPASVAGFYITKRSIDARGKQPWINLTVQAYIDEPFQQRPLQPVQYPDVTQATKKAIVIGAGPAGLFAALQLIEKGIQPIVLERGKDVRARRRDLAALNKEGVVNPESNYCFGEGGAGTYSDGKLYTRSNKRGDINRILNTFVQFGAEESILFDAHPHIGTNKLPQIITAMREQITACGGQFLFEQKVTGFILNNQTVQGVTTHSGDRFMAHAVIIATGHSARDIFTLLHSHNLLIESKPFALGVRIEHPQSLIDCIQYHCSVPAVAAVARDIMVRPVELPPASYSLVEQVDGRGVFSFCMCPGGIIAPAATSPGELVVNGWSPSKRNNPYANSGMVVQVSQHDAFQYFSKQPALFSALAPNTKFNETDPLLLMHFQQAVEQKSFNAGGGLFVAPAQRMADFCENKVSASLPDCSYLPGVHSTSLQQALPGFVFKSLQGGFKAFGKKMRGYYTNEAIAVATESRTSSPVRIPRDPTTLQHPQIKGLYPCGEGAGYAGGIVSAAMDGERVALAIAAVS
ncbi:NAD(P)/FAD-dependent oxidoreductase [Deminuibacter soli]|uniref:FAD-binding protein n=1 Tax=Deminuibacter soli TaxID=2291815 RepID=A0A3E1NEJ5_9BACT|nr:FAD-binding protein [Deminuibacter soli]RFM26188.1 FAD-binding protein [Deminuibacter soli]